MNEASDAAWLPVTPAETLHNHASAERVVERSSRAGWPERRVMAQSHRPGPPGLREVEAVVAPLVDAAFYRATNGDVRADGVDPVHHYCCWGWREGRDPSPAFSTQHYLMRHPDVAEQGINPLWHFAVIGRDEGRTAMPAETLPSPTVAALARVFNAAFYTDAYPDVVADGAEPFEHYVRFGLRERRAPNPWFDAGFYLRSDQELDAGGADPLLHYVLLGQAEGRAARDASPDLHAVLRDLRPASERCDPAGFPASVSLLDVEELTRLLSARLPCERLVVSLSHDAYTREVGGIQILIADEQVRFVADGAAYLHLAPVLPRLTLVRDGVPNPLRGTLDGAELGCFEASVLLNALQRLGEALPGPRLLVCHCLLGHDPATVTRLHAALEPARAVFWVHDYSSLCEGYTLLRNDLVFCGAPPADSMSCRICVHGAGRGEHLRAMEALFTAVPFDVVAPSGAALATWRAGTTLPHRSATVHPHAEPVFTGHRRSLVPEARHGTAAAPVRVAFVGHPAAHKGWLGFRRVVEDCRLDPAYAFFHLGVPEAAADLPVRNVAVRVSADARDAMRVALQEHAIELVLVLSPWPETFCFVAYEAIAAGADILALDDGGNVPATVLSTGRGVVFDAMEAVRDFFTSGRAVQYVRLALREGNPTGTLRALGATATLPPATSTQNGSGPVP